MERVMDGLYQTEKGAEVIRLRKKLVILDKQRQEGFEKFENSVSRYNSDVIRQHVHSFSSIKSERNCQ